MTPAGRSTSSSARLKRFLYRLSHYPPQAAYALGLGPIFGRMVLLLSTTGRRSGKRRTTPLQYVELDGKIYVTAAYGLKADWVRNILANPCVEVRVKEKRFQGFATVITDPERIGDMLELRLRLHPRMIGAILRSEGLPPKPGRADLVGYADKLAMVEITPEVALNNWDYSQSSGS
jgi:deazaflavin-dependent oxidoreductase (nitroreductase family)